MINSIIKMYAYDAIMIKKLFHLNIFGIINKFHTISSFNDQNRGKKTCTFKL